MGGEKKASLVLPFFARTRSEVAGSRDDEAVGVASTLPFLVIGVLAYGEGASEREEAVGLFIGVELAFSEELFPEFVGL